MRPSIRKQDVQHPGIRAFKHSRSCLQNPSSEHTIPSNLSIKLHQIITTADTCDVTLSSTMRDTIPLICNDLFSRFIDDQKNASRNFITGSRQLTAKPCDHAKTRQKNRLEPHWKLGLCTPGGHRRPNALTGRSIVERPQKSGFQRVYSLRCIYRTQLPVGRVAGLSRAPANAKNVEPRIAEDARLQRAVDAAGESSEICRAEAESLQSILLRGLTKIKGYYLLRTHSTGSILDRDLLRHLMII